jgi:hypothetical protein
MKKYKNREEVIVITPKVSLNGNQILDLTMIDKNIQNKVWYISNSDKSQLGYQYEITNIENDNDAIAWVYEAQLMSVEEAIKKGIVELA